MGRKQYISNSMDALIEISKSFRFWGFQILMIAYVAGGPDMEELTGINVNEEFSKYMRRLADIEDEE